MITVMIINAVITCLFASTWSKKSWPDFFIEVGLWALTIANTFCVAQYYGIILNV